MRISIEDLCYLQRMNASIARVLIKDRREEIWEKALHERKINFQNMQVCDIRIKLLTILQSSTSLDCKIDPYRHPELHALNLNILRDVGDLLNCIEEGSYDL